MGTLGKVIFGILGVVLLIIVLYYAAAVYLAGSVINALGDAAASSVCNTTTLADGSQKMVCSSSQSKPLIAPQPTSSTCNNLACNTMMKSYIDKNWKFKDSTTIFSDCKGCPSRWYDGTVSSIDGTNWIPTPNNEAAYKTLMIA